MKSLFVIVILFILIITVRAGKGTDKAEGLSAPVEIYRDTDGVPHIYADTVEDLFYAQGFVHAQDRFWQMEFWRRIGGGRLAELFGDDVLGVDIYLRTVDFRRIAEEEYAMLDEETRRFLDAYAAGVNAYILDRKPSRLGLEFRLLKLQGHELEIEPWNPVNTLTWLKIMAEDMSGNMGKELYTIDLIRAVGLEMTADFFPAYREEEMPFVVTDSEIIAQGKERENLDPAVLTEDMSLLMSLKTRLVGGYDPFTPLALGKGGGIGSNGWVLSGERTSTGKPILANDSHLGIQIPSVYYEVGLHSKKGGGRDGTKPFNARGFSFAGVPGIIMGHNDHIAWGLTNMGSDVQDLYIERINPYNPNQYEVNGQWVDMEIRREEIIVHKQDEPYILLVRSTRHGPVVTDQGDMISHSSFDIIPQKDFPDNLELTALSLRWTALQPTETIKTIFLVNKARNFEEFREAIRYFLVPPQNVIYADEYGNIGYQAPGLIPIRAKGNGQLPVPGWTDEYEWTGFIPFEELPWVFNPSKGYIATANNPIVSESYPYVLETEYDHGYRARRIVDIIEQGRSDFTLENMKAMQGDNLSLSALEIIPYLKDIIFEDTAIETARDNLLKWNGMMEMDSAEAALYGYFWVALVEEIFQDQIPERLWNKDKALGARSSLLSCVYNLLNEPVNQWWDDITTFDKTEARDDILARAFEKGYLAGVEELGEKLNKWSWGDIHTATFRNQTFGNSGIGIIERIFNRGPVAVSGSFHQLNRCDYSVEDAFNAYHISAMRQIIDLSDLSNSLMIHTPGQSGRPGNRHYDDLIKPWRLSEYHPTRWEKDEMKVKAVKKLVLKPF